MGRVGGCDYSLFSDGSKINFNQFAPLNFINSSMASNFEEYDIASIGLDIDFEVYIRTGVGVNDVIFEYSDNSDSALLRAFYIANPSRLRFLWRDNSGGTKGQVTVPIDLETWLTGSISISSTLMDATINGENDQDNTIGGSTSTTNRVTISNKFGGFNDTPVLVRLFEDSKIGSRSFLLNTDSGLNYIASKNDVLTLTNDPTYDARYPGLGNAVWPDGSVVSDPAIGAIKLFNQSLNGTIPSQNFNSGFDFLHKFMLEDTTANNEYALHLYNSAGSAEFNVYYNAGNVEIEIIDDAGTTQGTDNFSYTFDDDVVVRVAYDGTNATIYVDGTSIGSTAVNLTGGFTLDTVNVGNRQSSNNSDGYHYLTRLINNGTLVDEWHMEMRVSYDGDPDQLVVDGVNNNDLTLSSYLSLYPYTGAYLVSDNQCDDNDLLLDVNGRASQDVYGEFVRA